MFENADVQTPHCSLSKWFPTHAAQQLKLECFNMTTSRCLSQQYTNPVLKMRPTRLSESPLVQPWSGKALRRATFNWITGPPELTVERQSSGHCSANPPRSQQRLNLVAYSLGN